MLHVNGTAMAGQVSAVTTSGRGLSPEELTERLMVRLLFVAQSAPQPLREQVEAFADQMRALILAAMQQAARSERTTIYNVLARNGHEDIGKLLIDWKE